MATEGAALTTIGEVVDVLLEWDRSSPIGFELVGGRVLEDSDICIRNDEWKHIPLVIINDESWWGEPVEDVV